MTLDAEPGALMTLLATTFALIVALLAAVCPRCALAASWDAGADRTGALQAFHAGAALALMQRPAGTVERRDAGHLAASAAAGARWGVTATARTASRLAGAVEAAPSTWADRHPIRPMAWVGRRGITAGISIRW